MIFKCDSLEKELEKKKEKIRVWTNSGKQVQELIGNQNWKECLGYETEHAEKKLKEKKKHPHSPELTLFIPVKTNLSLRLR